MFKHILLPIDGSDASTRAVQTGARLAKALSAQVTVMIVVEHFSAGITPVSMAEDSPILSAADEAARHWLAKAVALVAAEGVVANQSVGRAATIYQGILDVAGSCGADAIVMGTHGAGALERLLLGSQTQRVLAHTQLPVLVVH